MQIKYVEVMGGTMAVSDPTSATLENVKAAAVKLDASLANAEVYQDGETVKFRISAGTKGAELSYVKYNGNTLRLSGTGANDPESIKRELVKLDASVANMAYRINEDTIEFYYQAGTKGQ